MGELADDVVVEVVEVDIVLGSAVWRAPAVVVIGWVEVALGEDEGEVVDAFIFLGCWSVGAEA